MAILTDTFDLAGLRLTSGEGRRLELNVRLAPLVLAGETYPVVPDVLPARLDISRTTGPGYALRLRFTATLQGPCMRCLRDASPEFKIDAREVSQPGGAEELDSPYVQAGLLDVAAWARDALALALPPAVLCTPDCAGLCPICGVALARAGPEHTHERAPDPRWAKLAELELPSEASGG